MCVLVDWLPTGGVIANDAWVYALRQMVRLIWVAVFAVAVVSGCEDKCGCGVKGCKHLHEHANCNSDAAQKLKNSLCGETYGSVSHCGAVGQPDRLPAAQFGQCEIGLPPDIGTTVGVTVLSYLAWVPLLARAKYYQWE